jgi:hypothetical protein
VARYLRLTRREYDAVALAARPLPSSGPDSAFQSRLAEALRDADLALAQWVARLGADRLRLLRGHLRRPGPGPAAAGGLGWRESRELAGLCALFCLRGGCLASFRAFLLERAGPLAPVLGRLSAAQLTALHRRALSGLRWCP